VPNEEVKAPTLDVLIGDVIGKGTRFRSIEISTSGLERSYSYRAAGSPNPSEVSPISLYQRIFGEGFQDPNSADFKPDPHTMVRQSVLSAVQEDRGRLMREVGVDDRRRLEEYFTSIRSSSNSWRSNCSHLHRFRDLSCHRPPAGWCWIRMLST
jgi:hypothetical protein